MTAPYWGTTSELVTVPPHKQGPEGRGDAVDWAIFMLILAGTLFGFLVMIHQVGIVIDKRLRFRHIFHPTMSETDWASDDEMFPEGEKSPLRQGGGFLHSELRMTVESIPVSMGGEDAPTPPTAYHDHRGSPSLVEADDSHSGLNLEMAERRNGGSLTAPKATSSAPTPVSFGDEGSPSELPDSLRIKRDTPDLVERPSLKSMSKIALPKHSPILDELDFRKPKARVWGRGPALPL